MSDHEKLIELCDKIKKHKTFLSYQEQEQIDKRWKELGLTSYQKQKQKKLSYQPR